MSNGFLDQLKREWAISKIMSRGYPRLTAGRWCRAVKRDEKNWAGVYSAQELKRAHDKGFLGKSIAQLDRGGERWDRISDLDYIYLRPMNNSFSKWIEDINTMVRMHPKHEKNLPHIYFSIVNRNGLKILEFPFATRMCRVGDIIAVLERAGKTLKLRPAFWNSKGERFDIDYEDHDHVRVNGQIYTVGQFYKLLTRMSGNYLLCDKIRYSFPLTEEWNTLAFYKFYIVNDCEGSHVVTALMETFPENESQGEQHLIEKRNGTFTMDGRQITIPRWESIKSGVLDLAASMPQLDYFSVSVVLTEDGYMINNCSYAPFLPRIAFDEELNAYLKQRLAQKREIKVPFSQKWKYVTDRLFARFVKQFCRPGIRPYMQMLWFKAVWSDLKWNGRSLSQKIWAWKRGYLSYRIDQYGLTEENHATMLSDYDYHWLNRMNNIYQVWISDKTTFRYTMEPMKACIPDYYFSVFKKNGQVMVSAMQDCPQDAQPTVSGIVELLRKEKILVFKPSAGLHGDGFYCLEFRDDEFWINGQTTTAEGIEKLICEQRSIYVVTSYIFMHPELKKIYPTSVNSIRVMAINRHGYDPVIGQTYMRIGSSKTGYTDNVGYGGICAMIDIQSGKLHDPETLRDHIYYPCPQHPDTGTEIAGITIPHWALICENVGKICQLFPELEYLGFDVAVTEEGFQIMEINVHQDLHKVALHSEEVREFYRERIRYKKRLNGLQ